MENVGLQSLHQLKARVTAFARGSADTTELAGLHVAVMQYGAENDATGSDGSERALAELVDLASHTVRVFSSVAPNGSGTRPARAGRSTSELLDLLPTIAKTTSAIGGPAYDGAITAEALGLATAGAWAPPTVLPVLNLFAELPGVMSDDQATELCAGLVRVADSAPAADIPGVCRALVNLVTKHPTSTVWPSAFRAVLQRVPSTSMPTAFCMIDLALQHAPATGGTLIASFQAETMSKIDVPEFMLLLILSQTHAYKEQALSLLTAAFAADAELDGEHSHRSSRSDDIGHGVDDAVASLGGVHVPADHSTDGGGIISAIVQAVTSADARLVRTLTELGLHWCDTAGSSNRATRLRHTGCHLLCEVFTQHGAARREVLSVAFSAVIEEPSLQVKYSYCSLIEHLLTRHREMMNDHTAILQAWLSSIQMLQFTLQKRIVNAVLSVAAVNGPLTSHVSMTMRKLMMQKATDSRLVALHGLCAVVRTGVSHGAATHMADAIAALKSAFDMGYSVRKQLYLELAGLFRSCKDRGTSAVDVHLNVLQQRVRSQFLRYVDRADAHESESASQSEPDVSIRWCDCFECVGQHAYAKEPLAELVGCVLELLSSSADRSASDTGIEMKLLMPSVLSIVQQCCTVEIICDWGPDAIISMQQKLGIVLPLQQIILEWLPTIAKESRSGVYLVEKTNDTDGGSTSAQPEPLKAQQFWLTESYAMLSTACNILGNELATDSCTKITPSRACSLLEPYLAYMDGAETFRQAFGLPTAQMTANTTPDQVPDSDTPAETKTGGGRVLRQRRSGKTVPWWVGNASPASSQQRRGKDPQDIAEDGEGTAGDEGPKVEKAFPPGVYVCTDIIRCYLQGIVGSVDRTPTASNGDDKVGIVSASFSRLVSLYSATNSMQWDTPETAEDARAGWDSDDATSSDFTFSGFQAGITSAAHGERRAYADSIIYPKLLQPIESMVPKSKRSRLQLHSQQEMCYYKTRAACLDALSAAATYAQRCVGLPGGVKILLQCPALVEAYRLQPDLVATTAHLSASDVCVVYFSRQLRDEVAAGITPPLLTAYVRWIQCLLPRTGADAPADECRRLVAESFHSILSTFEIDAPGIVKILLQALLDLSLPRDASDTALCVLRTLLPKKLSKSSGLSTAGKNDDLLVSASLQCKHAAVRAAVRHLVSELKATPAETCDSRTLATTIELLCVVVGEKSASRHAPLRPVLAGLTQITIARAADVGRVLYDTWPSTRRQRGNRGGRLGVDNIDMWPALYTVVENCMLKLLPAVRECAWLQTEGPLESGRARKWSSSGRQQSQIPRVLQAMEDFDAEVMQLCQLSTRDGASAFDSIAGGVAQPIIKSLKAIESAIAKSAHANTAAAAQEAQRLLPEGSRHPRKQSLQAKRTTKRKRHVVRSRNSYVDAVLNDEEDGGDNYADLEDWIVFKRGRTYK